MNQEKQKAILNKLRKVLENIDSEQAIYITIETSPYQRTEINYRIKEDIIEEADNE